MIHEFSPTSSATLLDQIESEGIKIPYQCREGYCGSCRTQLVSGDVEYIEEPLAMINEGEILPCCCRAMTTVSIQA